MKWLAAAWVILIAATALAQPAPRYSVAAAYDADRRELIVFGGRSGSGEDSDETWRWNDSAGWTRLPVSGPSARNGATMVWDAARRHIVLFGGVRGQTPLGDTWSWNGSQWTQRSTSGPPARTTPGLTYDSRRQRVVLFGGLSNTSLRGDTWEWDGNQWREVATQGPAPRMLHGFSYHEGLGVVMLYAGAGTFQPGGARTDTWLYDGATWSEAVVADAPARRDHVAMAYDATLQRVIAFGGNDGERIIASPLEWDGREWLPSPASGMPPRAWPVLVADAERGRLLLFGGFTSAFISNELWSFECDRWTRLN